MAGQGLLVTDEDLRKWLTELTAAGLVFSDGGDHVALATGHPPVRVPARIPAMEVSPAHAPAVPQRISP